jgi:PIN domain nuclease of toxin-antitoxin system
VVSLWEIAIKTSLGKLDLNGGFNRFLERDLPALDALILPIEPRHLAAVAGLPFFHRDPFDRLLVAQTITEGLAIISRDASFREYGILVIY